MKLLTICSSSLFCCIIIYMFIFKISPFEFFIINSDFDLLERTILWLVLWRKSIIWEGHLSLTIA